MLLATSFRQVFTVEPDKGDSQVKDAEVGESWLVPVLLYLMHGTWDYTTLPWLQASGR